MFEDDDDEIAAGPEEGAPADPHAWPGAAPKQAAFLTAYVTCGGRISWAAKAARISRNMHYRWLAADAAYKPLFADAELQAGDVLEEEAKRRAIAGYYEPVFYQGEQCGKVLRFSDGLMQLLLKGSKPAKYRENTSVEHKTADGQPLQLEVVFRKPA
jgi:hypothetical protein